MKFKTPSHRFLFSLGLILSLLALARPAMSQGLGPTLFVDNSSDGAGASVLIYDGANTTGGDAAPDRKLWNPMSAAPYGVAYDATGDRLWVSIPAKNCILVFDQAGTAAGLTRPDRIITGSNTRLSAPYGLFFDAANDRLYVASYMNSSVLIFNNAGSAEGDVTPARVISGDNSTLWGPRGLTLDTAADRLYVANTYAETVAVFDNAGSLNGDIAPSRVISGEHTLLNNPWGVELDATRDQLYVINRTSSYSGRPVVVFTATTASGDIAPTRSINHEKLSFSTGSFLLNDTLYIATEPDNAINIYDNASTLDGTPAPTRELSGSGITTLVTVRNLFVDAAGGDMYVANYTVANVTGYIPVFAGAGSIDGAVAPERIIEDSSRLGFNVMNLHFDAAHERLYVMHDPNGGDDAIQVYDDALNVDGDVPPTRMMTSTFYMESAMAIDEGRDLLYVAGYDPDSSTDGIGIFSGIGYGDGQIPFARFLTNHTWLENAYNIRELAVDSTRDQLYILNNDPNDGKIIVFNAASSADGETYPVRIIRGANTLLNYGPLDMVLDVTGDRLYVSTGSPDTVLIFDDISSTDGNVAPTRVISGSNTTFDVPAGLALDTTGDTLYVSSAGSPSNGRPSCISVFEHAGSANGNIAPARTIEGSNTELYFPGALALGSAPDLALTKTAHAPEVVPGGTITYSLTYANTMSGSAGNAFIVDTLSPYVTHLACTGGTSCDAAGNAVTWYLGNVPAGSGGTVTLTVQASGGTNQSGVIANTAIFSSPTASEAAVAGVEVHVIGWSYDIYLPLVLRSHKRISSRSTLALDRSANAVLLWATDAR